MKKIAAAIVILLLIAGGIGYYIWNKPPEKVENRKSVPVLATELVGAFTTDEAAANRKYLNQVLEVSGTVAETSKNQDGKTVILLESGDPLSGVQCTMRDDGITINNGAAVKVTGFCNGYTMVVLLSDCIIKHNGK